MPDYKDSVDSDAVDVFKKRGTSLSSLSVVPYFSVLGVYS